MTSNVGSEARSEIQIERQNETRSDLVQVGRLQVHFSRRDVSMDGCSVPIGSRAFEIFELLIRAEGTLVSKDEIISKVWPKTIVEENNIQVHISALRKLLGANREMIQTVPGRGYRLVRSETQPAPSLHTSTLSFPSIPIASPHNLPAWSSKLIGREEAIADIACSLRSTRLLTIVAAGGMGKTRLAIEVARDAMRDFPDGVYLLNFATVSDAEGVLDEFTKVTTSVGKKVELDVTRCVMTGATDGEKYVVAGELEDRSEAAHVVRNRQFDNHAATAAPSMLRFMNRRALFVLDNCEHVLDAATALAETILSATNDACVLATSREALRTSGEQLYRLAPLVMPDAEADDASALQCSAVALFLLRAHAAEPAFGRTPGSVSLISAICRRLDGMPLAIELAAARAVVLGAIEVSRSLNDRFMTLTGGHRTALPRHQTLKATLDWSHDFLNASERLVLRRLSVFADSFTLKSANAVINDPSISADDAATLITSLAHKSLVVIQTGSVMRYRLLETTRAYAMQKLEDNGESRQVAANHARLIYKLMVLPRGEGGAAGRYDGSVVPDADLGNTREALTWAFSPTGDMLVAVRLAAACAPLFFNAAMIGECCEWTRKAIDALDVISATVAHGHDAKDDDRAEEHATLRLRLLSAQAAARLYAEGPIDETRALWTQALSLAKRGRHREFEARAMWGLSHTFQYAGAPKEALRHAERFHEVEISQAPYQVLGHCLLGVAHHFAGDQQTAHRHLAEMLNRYDKTDHRHFFFGVSLDHHIVAGATLARVLWLEGQLNEATAMAEQAMREGGTTANDMSIGYALVEALIPLSLLSGDWAQVKSYSNALKRIASRAGLRIWEASSRCFGAALDFHEEASFEHLAALTTALAKLTATGFLAHETFFFGLYAQALHGVGEDKRALEQLDKALARSIETGAAWYDSELWRMKGEILLQRSAGPPFSQRTQQDERDAQACFRHAMDIAQQQHAHLFFKRAKDGLANVYRPASAHPSRRSLLTTQGKIGTYRDFEASRKHG